MNTIKDFIHLISELVQFFIDLTEIEKTKLEATRNKSVSEMENCMKQEQASLLRLRGLDKKREDIQKTLHFENLTFREILPLTEGKDQIELKNLFDSLQHHYTLYNSVSKSAKSAIEDNLYKIDKLLTLLNSNQNPPANSGVYTSDGSLSKIDKPKFTSRKV